MPVLSRKTVQSLGLCLALAAALLILPACRDNTEESEYGRETEHMMEEQQDDAHMMDQPQGHHSQDSAHTPVSGELKNGTRVVSVTARKFQFEPETIVVNQGESVRLKVTSQDVSHGIAIADYDIDKKLPPEETVEVEFSADKPGTHHFHCSVYCGAGHDKMHGKLIVRESGRTEEGT